MTATQFRPLSDDIFFADFPVREGYCEAMDKYDLRDWLIGQSVRLGWKYFSITPLLCSLKKKSIGVRIQIVSEGLMIHASGRKTELVKTKL